MRKNFENRKILIPYLAALWYNTPKYTRRVSGGKREEAL